MAETILAEHKLTPKEWNEIKECTDALTAVVSLFRKRPREAETGGPEALESIQRRLDLAVTSAANRINGDDWECPLCGNTTPPHDTSPDSGSNESQVCAQDDKLNEGEAAIQ